MNSATFLNYKSASKMKNTGIFCICHLYTSYYSGRLWPNQMVKPTSYVKDKDTSRKQIGDAPSCNSYVTDKTRNYVPLNAALIAESQADYLLSSDCSSNHKRALEKLGLALAASIHQQGEENNQTVRIYIKLIRSLRQGGLVRESLQCGKKVLNLMKRHKINGIHLDNYIEALLEFALTVQEAPIVSRTDLVKKRKCGSGTNEVYSPVQLYEEVISVFERSHDMGNSERYTRQIPRTRKMNQQGFDAKWIHYSPFDYDRCLSLVDTALENAERFFTDTGKLENAENFLNYRCSLMEKKNFNRRMFCGKIETMRGKPNHRNCRLTSNPTPEEIFCFYPTVHNSYYDYRQCTTAPLDNEAQVCPGINRTVADGDPLRRQPKFYRLHDSRKNSHNSEMKNLQYR